MPAQRTLEFQSALPSQAEGGFSGDFHSSVHKALCAWEKKRNLNSGFRYGHGSAVYSRKVETAQRSEISWNSAPEVKRAPDPAKIKMREEAARMRHNQRMREMRAKETPEQKEARLSQRRATRKSRSTGLPYKQRPKITCEERKAAVKAAKARYLERQKLGLVAKTLRPPSKLTPEQLKRKAERARKYYYENKNSAISAS
jgi:hypothetical protein